jgi:signal transduction histidine kinase
VGGLLFAAAVAAAVPTGGPVAIARMTFPLLASLVVVGFGAVLARSPEYEPRHLLFVAGAGVAGGGVIGLLIFYLVQLVQLTGTVPAAWQLGLNGVTAGVAVGVAVGALFVQVRQQRRALARRTDRLRRQNERLERFGELLSHDLRNPLAVARGQLAHARARGGDAPEALAGATDALDRMDALIDDVLAFAREGQVVVDPEPVDVERVVRDAWASVDTTGAALVVGHLPRVPADDSRLARAFENLFRNSVEHGSAGGTGRDGNGGDDRADWLTDDDDDAPADPDVTVTVEPTADGDGLVVRDDGLGLPDAIADPFELGTSTAADGTGFGLAIVRTVVEGHGWTVEAVDTDADEGAAFRIEWGDRPPS